MITKKERYRVQMTRSVWLSIAKVREY
jgi:hypothetical protein